MIVLVAAIVAVGACSSDDEPSSSEYVEQPVEQLYNSAMNNMETENFREAATGFEEVERQHPYSQWATRSQVMSAYAYYEAGMYDESVAAAQRFVDLHPGHKDAPYAYYLIGVCYYEQISDIGRDQEMTRLAFESFDELIRRYPESEYARDGQLKADLARDHLAGKEMDVGRFYLTRERYIAAINRFRIVIERYQTTTHVPEALYRLTEAYLSLGIEREARASAAVLGYNFPGNKWYERSYALLESQDLEPAQDGEESWISSIF